MSTLVFDIEANGFYEKVNKIHCIVTKDIHTGEINQYPPDRVEDGIRALMDANVLIGHNIIRYDVPVLEKLYPQYKLSDKLLMDTFTLSSLLNADRPSPVGSNKPHSLEAWGIRCGRDKVEHEDWDHYSPEMLHRCTEDVQINQLVFNHLMEEITRDKKLQGVDWSKAIKLEMECAKIIAEQEKYGWYFDRPYAEKLLNQLDRQIETLDKFLTQQPWPHKVEFRGEFYPWKSGKEDYLLKKIKPAFIKEHWFSEGTEKVSRKNVFHPPFNLYVEEANKWVEINHLEETPEYNSRFEKIFVESGQEPEGLFSLVDIHTFNYKSGKQLIGHMLDLKWTPIEYTDKNNPSITPQDLINVFGEKVGKAIQLYNDLGKVRSKIANPEFEDKGMLAAVRPDNRIASICNPQATPTGRARHAVVVNIPKINYCGETNRYLYFPEGKILYGTELRSLFCAPEGSSIVGCDASGLELRMLAHYMDDPIFTRELLTGDIHSFNQKKAGLPTRDNAKTFIYGFLYGAGNEKVGKIVNGDSRQGKALKDKFIAGLPSLGTLIETAIARATKHGYLIGLDGRKLNIREDKEYAALNTLLQSAGAVVMKVAMVVLHKSLKAKGLDKVAKQVGWYHDEFQLEVVNGYEDEVGEVARQAIITAGQVLGLKCPLDGEYKVGLNWCQTH